MHVRLWCRVSKHHTENPHPAGRPTCCEEIVLTTSPLCWKELIINNNKIIMLNEKKAFTFIVVFLEHVWQLFGSLILVIFMRCFLTSLCQQTNMNWTNGIDVVFTVYMNTLSDSTKKLSQTSFSTHPWSLPLIDYWCSRKPSAGTSRLCGS